MRLMDIKGKKANEIRWEALKLLDWEKDSEEIERIFNVSNPRFFSSRTPDQVVETIRAEIERDNNFRKACEQYMIEHADEMMSHIVKEN